MTTPLTEQGSAAIAALPGNFSNDVTLNTHKLLLVSPGTAATDGINKAQLDALGVPSGRNRLINGDARVQQRAVVDITTNGNGYGSVDRFKCGNIGTGGTFTLGSTVAANTLGVSVQFIRNLVKVAPTTLTGNNYVYAVNQVIEGVNVYDLVGKQVTASFLFRSSTPGQYSVAILAAGSTAYSCVKTFNYTTADTTQRVTLTFPAIPTATGGIPEGNAAGAQLIFAAVGTGTQQAPSTDVWLPGSYFTAPGNVDWTTAVNNYVALTDVQLEEGTVATPFERLPFSTAFAMCQRYYQVSPQVIYGGPTTTGIPYWTSTALQTAMRGSPTGAGVAVGGASNFPNTAPSGVSVAGTYVAGATPPASATAGSGTYGWYATCTAEL